MTFLRWLWKLPLIPQDAPVELITDPKPRLLQGIQVRLDRLDVPVLLGVDEHSDEAEMRNVEMGSGFPTVSLVHQQQRRLRFHRQCDRLGLSGVQILAERADKILILHRLSLDPRR